MEEIALLGRVPVAPLDVRGAAERVMARDPADPFAYVATINAQTLLLAERPETRLRAAYDAAWLRLNDSTVLARLQRLALGTAVPVCPGSDLTLHLLTHHLRPDDAVTIVGGDAAMVAALRERFGLRRIAHHEPPMGYAEEPAAWDAAAAFLRDHPARLAFVATGAPRSERLMHEVARRGGATGTALAVGSSLLFAAGLTPRAPEGMRRAGLEWLHRAATEPRRLGARYAADLLPLLRLARRARTEARAR